MDATIDALRRDAEYQKYIETLTKTNYFKGEVTDSKRWKDLEEKAAAVFLEVRNTECVPLCLENYSFFMQGC